MLRILSVLSALLLVAPALAQGLSAEAMAKQNQAIALSIKEQITRCWALPPGHEGLRLALDVAFFGNGALDGAPALSADSRKLASKHPALGASVVRAVQRCAPLGGLEALGAGATERFAVTVYFQS